MQKEPIVLEGRFTLWTYDVSHGLMLFRRNPAPGQKRAEILFLDVRAMEIAAWGDDIRIEEADSQTTHKFENARLVREPRIKTFKVTSKQWTGFVWATGFNYSVDDGAMGDPSSLYKPGPLMKRLASAGYLLD
jgi:hypothetical protein